MPYMSNRSRNKFTPYNPMLFEQRNVETNGRSSSPNRKMHSRGVSRFGIWMQKGRTIGYALTTIVTEAFLTGWHTRNEAIFKGKNKTEKGTQILFLHRLRARLKTDQIRWGNKLSRKNGAIYLYIRF
jgi:hypothetical protein